MMTRPNSQTAHSLIHKAFSIFFMLFLLIGDPFLIMAVARGVRRGFRVHTRGVRGCRNGRGNLQDRPGSAAGNGRNGAQAIPRLQQQGR